MKKLTLLPTEIALIILVDLLISTARSTEDYDELSQGLINFLAISFCVGEIPSYESADELYEELKQFTHENMIEHISKKFNEYSSLESVHELISRAESYIIESSIEQISSSAPTKFASNSEAGMFIRKITTKWKLSNISENLCSVINFCDFCDNSSQPAAMTTPNNVYSNVFDCYENFDNNLFQINYYNKPELEPRSNVNNNTDRIFIDSLVQLSSCWTILGNADRSVVANEEALKYAHQRGDHESVTRCLLTLSESCEYEQNLIIRSMIKASNLQHKELVIDAALRLFISRLLDYSSFQTCREISDLWYLLQFACMSEEDLTRKFAMEHVANINDIQSNKASNLNGKKQIVESYSGEAWLWLRLNHPDLSTLSILRAFSSPPTTSFPAMIISHLFSLFYFVLNGFSESINAEKFIQEVEALFFKMTKLSSTLLSEIEQHTMSSIIEFTGLYTLLLKLCERKDYDRALSIVNKIKFVSEHGRDQSWIKSAIVKNSIEEVSYLISSLADYGMNIAVEMKSSRKLVSRLICTLVD